MAFQIEEGNLEALQCLASVRMSQQRSEDARGLVKQVWNGWKAVEGGQSSAFSTLCDTSCFLKMIYAHPRHPSSSLSHVCFIELAEYKDALDVLQVALQVDEEDVEAWYLRGWCFVLMAQLAKEKADGRAGGDHQCRSGRCE